MTVAELIEKLKTMPQEAVVIYALYSDYSALEADDIELHLASEEKVKYRGNRFSNVQSFEKAQEALDYRDVVIFPGN